jgi:hypothetical protein
VSEITRRFSIAPDPISILIVQTIIDKFVRPWISRPKIGIFHGFFTHWTNIGRFASVERREDRNGRLEWENGQKLPQTLDGPKNTV